MHLPAVIACAERLCEPAKMPPAARAAVDVERIRLITAAELGDGPWGDAASRTTVGEVRAHVIARDAVRLDGTVQEQAQQAADMLTDIWSVGSTTTGESLTTQGERAPDGSSMVVLVEPRRDRNARELLAEATALVGARGDVVAVTVGDGLESAAVSSWGADRIVRLDGSLIPQDLATGLLTGDATGLEIVEGRLVAWKPAFGGSMRAAIRCRSDIQAATIRHGALSFGEPRLPTEIAEQHVLSPASAPITTGAETEDDDPDLLASADVVMGVGTGVAPEDYHLLEPLRTVLGAELAATRRVTDNGWLPHSRQVGVTGRHISPRLYIAIGVAGKANHMIGVRNATRILAINHDPAAPIFDAADIGMVADWCEAIPALATRLSRH